MNYSSPHQPNSRDHLNRPRLIDNGLSPCSSSSSVVEQPVLFTGALRATLFMVFLWPFMLVAQDETIAGDLFVSGGTVTAGASTNLSLLGGSAGASLMLGQGTNGRITFAPTGMNYTQFNNSGGAHSIIAYFGTQSNSFNNLYIERTNDASFVNLQGTKVAVGATSITLQAQGGNVLVGGTTDISGSGGLKVFGTAAATSTTTGAFQVAGGAGIAGALYIGGTSTFQSNTNATTPQTGGVIIGSTGTNATMIGMGGGRIFAGGLISAGGGLLANGAVPLPTATGTGLYLSAELTSKRIYYGDGTGYDFRLSTRGGGVTTDRLTLSDAGVLLLTATAPATSTATGALQVAGGVGIGGAGYFGGNLITGGPATVWAASDRPITIGTSDGGINMGGISFRGDAGGWAFGLHAKGSNGADRGGFGFVGGADSLSNYYIGSSYMNPAVTITPAGNVTINGNLNLAGSFSAPSYTATSGGITGGGSGLALSAGGTGNQNITLTPTGTGSAIIEGATLALKNDSASAYTLLSQIVANRETYDPTGNSAAIQFYRGGNTSEGRIVFATNPGVLTGQQPIERMQITEAGNVGIGANNPSRLFQVGNDVSGIGFQPGISPHAGALRFGDGTGWKLHFGRSRETVNGALNSGATGALLTIQDNGNVGIGTTDPTALLDISSGGDGAGRFSVVSASTNVTSLVGSPLVLQNKSATAGNYAATLYYDATGNLQGSIGMMYGAHSGMNQGSFYIEPRIVGTPATFVVAASGNVGIGSATPDSKLHVISGSSNEVFRFDSTTGSGTYGSFRKDGMNFGYIGSAGSLTASGGVGDFAVRSQNALKFATGGNADRMVIDSNGFVGIGTTSPSAKLDVNGSVRFVGSVGSAEFDDSGARLQFTRNSANYITASNAGGYLSFGTGGVEHRVVIDAAGAVGIGRFDPQAKLHVAGDLRVDTALSVTGVTTLSGPFTAAAGAQINGPASLQSAAVSGVSSFGGAMTFGPGTNTGGTLDWGSAATDTLKLTAGSGRALFLAGGNSTASGLTIDSVGKVGIGTTTPQARLSVIGAYVDLNTPQLIVDGGVTGAVIGLSTNGTQRGKLRVDSTGNVSLESTGTGGLDFNWAGGLGPTTFWNGAGVALATIKQTGNLGIGTTSPVARLDVAGDGKFTSSLAVNTNGAPAGGLTIGSSATSSGGNLRLLSNSSRWGFENDNGTLRFFREDQAGANKQTKASVASDASLVVEGRVTSRGLTISNGGDINLSSQKMVNVGAPTLGTDATNKGYVDTGINNAVPFTWQGGNIALKNSADRLGLGTTTPSYKLDIFHADGARLNNLGSGKGLVLTRDTYGNSQSWMLGVGITSGSGSTFKITDVSASNADRLAITSTGKVGVGTTVPQGQFSVAYSNDQLAVYEIGDNRVGLQTILDGQLLSGYNYGGDENRLVLQPLGGDVGIGTTATGGARLAVAGKIRAREVVVDDLTWSDYVFADNYRNAPLSEVEAHIKEHKHLPGVPSAKEVSENGVSLGQMQAVLLAKIEELTLHQIAQEKRIKRLEDENASLRAAQ